MLYRVKRIKRIKVKAVLITLGCCFIFAAAALTVHNHRVSGQAGAKAAELSSQLLQMLENNAQSGDSRNEDDTALSRLEIGETEEIVTVDAGEYTVCGIVSIPSIGVELAVIDNWSYPKLQISANRYYGSPDTQLVIMAHNYARHFGKINQLRPGDEVRFMDTQGTVYRYTVSETVSLASDQLREAVAGQDWDLTLFTCTYGGANRVVVRCRAG